MAPPAKPSVHTVAACADADDECEIPPETINQDYSQCGAYFSAYGLSPSQYKWVVQNQKKKYPSVCPAPTPAMVDFIVIFTHDVDFFNVTMPEPIHTDKNGFSDFTPLIKTDGTLVSDSNADKAHREYVWVFHTKRGAFDPAKFSARRRPQFVKAESNSLTSSHAGPRTVEDALQYIEAQGTTR